MLAMFDADGHVLLHKAICNLDHRCLKSNFEEWWLPCTEQSFTTGPTPEARAFGVLFVIAYPKSPQAFASRESLAVVPASTAHLFVRTSLAILWAKPLCLRLRLTHWLSLSSPHEPLMHAVSGTNIESDEIGVSDDYAGVVAAFDFGITRADFVGGRDECECDSEDFGGGAGQNAGNEFLAADPAHGGREWTFLHPIPVYDRIVMRDHDRWLSGGPP